MLGASINAFYGRIVKSWERRDFHIVPQHFMYILLSYMATGDASSVPDPAAIILFNTVSFLLQLVLLQLFIVYYQGLFAVCPHAHFAHG